MLRRIQGQADLSLDIGGQILDGIKDLDIEFGFERSVRLSKSTVQGNRFLLSMSAADLLQRVAPVDLFSWLRLPPSLTVDAILLAQRATHVHIGVEEDHESPLLKVYFEKTTGHQPHQTPTGWMNPEISRNSKTLYVACKWKPSDGNHWVITNYTEPVCDESLRERVYGKLRDSKATLTPLQEFSSSVIDVCQQRCSLGDCRFLEVSEASNLRRSFDLNLYAANICLGDVGGVLKQLCRHFQLPDDVQNRFIKAVQDETLGHLAAGLHRNGAPFVTLYHGVAHERCA